VRANALRSLIRPPRQPRPQCSNESLGLRGHFGNAGAPDEGLVAGTAHDQRVQILARGQPVDRRDEFAHQRAIERVELRPVIDAEKNDRSAWTFIEPQVEARPVVMTCRTRFRVEGLFRVAEFD
jgi:hypothetical protein